MLQPIEEIVTDPVHRLFCRFDAVCVDTGAYLFRTNGRTRGGLPKYILIKPNEKPANLQDMLKGRGDWEYENRKFIRTWSLQEAIEIGNQRLAKMEAAAVKRMAERLQETSK